MSADLTEQVSLIFDHAKAEALALLKTASDESSDTPLLDAREVALKLHTNTQAVYRLGREGKLPPVKLSPRNLRWTKEAVTEFLNRNPCG